MSKNLTQLVFVMTAVGAAALSTAQDTYVFDWTQGAQNSDAGTLNRLTTTYTASSNRMTFRANFGAAPNNPNVKTDGFWVALSGGPNPKGHGGELAILYFDATGGSPKLTAYNYNGENGYTSYYDGSPAAGTQTPDRIKSSLNTTDWINDLRVENNNDGTRTMLFDIDATDINGHSPSYPGNTPWTGVAYGPKIGIWMHHVAGLDTSYQGGYIKDFDFKKQGWLDLSDQNTTVVPEPATMAALGIGVAALLKRRKKTS